VRQHADAVAVVPGEIGVDEMVGDGYRLGRVAAGLFEQGADKAAQPLMIDPHGFESGRWPAQASSAEWRAQTREKGLARRVL